MALTKERREYLAKWRVKNRDKIRKQATEWRLKQGKDPNYFYKEEDINKITTLYKEGCSLMTLSKMFNRDRQRMGNMLTRNGVRLRTHAEALALLRVPHPERCGWRLQEWSQNVIQRDKECAECGSTENLEAHHIIRKVDDWRKAYDISNGITLCHKCHKKTDTYGKKNSQVIKMKI